MLLVSNVQRFSLQDGPGIRTTVFLKGCPFHCAWCCNPENQAAFPQYYFKAARCLRNQHTDCRKCELVLDSIGASEPQELAGRKIPPQSENKEKGLCALALGIWGRWYGESELINLLMRDVCAYEKSGGGVTLSGGEPLSHPIASLVRDLSHNGIQVAIETSLLMRCDSFSEILEATSLFIVDAKVMDVNACLNTVGGDVGAFRDNLAEIVEAEKDVILRIPLIEGVTATAQNTDAICALVEHFHIRHVQLLPVHHLGDEKAAALGMPSCEVGAPAESEVLSIAAKLSAAGSSVTMLAF